ncbi:PTS sugar transporter subunit IIA [Calorimonas adulescens]|uniref:PTS glucose transporter subunit IIA n=1 Tax=Calorimonas adulescens TaxID=2606906 RepID=A0A5D8QI20_9THEO|nr:PTS glucose transporter subunit IIA [Calorimonas adulescens]MDI6600875.1 PTS glucose transporter subunit IIA [Thermoanaerobacteraceae bacterium]TZE82948.1 PTS glucose transporter subunit IIA [Calorimonas adulescens]
MVALFGFFKRHNTVDIFSPVNGTIVDLGNVPDPVFAQKMVGDGVAIEPTDGLIVSPVDGEVLQLFPTLHAIGLRSKEGLETLIHIGIDTVELKGDGFTALIKQGDVVTVGTPLIKVDLDKLKSSGKSAVTPVILTNGEIIQSIEKRYGDVEAGVDTIMVVAIK